ncbi:hypothetical protein CBR_g22111 [Chara braunii]|uniref:DDE Tnp4 domain-containing protein n=1 Tax=Chara braunii TaxID=69332 RepID=A0A388L218_CHABU|nr:hypothetical protein CBR_g22111 [Chara braunii]|eukprot:GBG76364.1 hypothetical protein CBR_g22111 [Chara braunii]
MDELRTKSRVSRHVTQGQRLGTWEKRHGDYKLHNNYCKHVCQGNLYKSQRHFTQLKRCAAAMMDMFVDIWNHTDYEFNQRHHRGIVAYMREHDIADRQAVDVQRGSGKGRTGASQPRPQERDPVDELCTPVIFVDVNKRRRVLGAVLRGEDVKGSRRRFWMKNVYGAKGNVVANLKQALLDMDLFEGFGAGAVNSPFYNELFRQEKTTVAAAAVAVVRRFQVERAVGHMKATLSRRRQRLLLQTVLDVLDCITTSEAVVQLCAAIKCGVLPRATPRWWMRQRAGMTWEDLRVCDDEIDDYFREKLRMSRRVFMEITEACAAHLQRHVTFYREPLQPEQIVAYKLYRWVTGKLYDKNTSSFGMGRASGVRAVRDVRSAMLRVYGDKISWPTRVRKHFVLRAFLDKGFLDCHGAIDCTHIYVDKPANVPSENYFDRKHCFSVIAQVVVDLDLHVLDVSIGYPESCHNIRVIQLSSLYRRAEEGMLFRGPPVTLPGGVRTNGYILGDNGYPPSEWVVVPSGGMNQHPDEERFDTKKKVARGIV